MLLYKKYRLYLFCLSTFILSLHCDELYFRDYLNCHSDKVKEYEQLKFALYNKYQPNRDLYTKGKSEFANFTI